ncbi:hypothetical protein [Pseudomonas aeruginosa]|uniref:hypothetical protein n=1 Tax=Pseudomonas aeruginosa TaxID=287 RepID=UPI000EB5E88F|nr:hypothetical protein [Pseudomonas aeruginosa]
MTLPLEVDATQFTRKRLMVTLRLPKEGMDQQPQIILEAEDSSGIAVALFGPDSPAARADAARMMALWNDALPSTESPVNDFPGKSKAWIKGRAAAILWGDDWEFEAPCPYSVGTPDASDWESGIQAGLDYLSSTETTSHSTDDAELEP